MILLTKSLFSISTPQRSTPSNLSPMHRIGACGRGAARRLGQSIGLRAFAVSTTMLMAATATAAPISVSLSNLQPVDQESIIETPYDPTHPDAEIMWEQMHLDETSIPSYRTNIDFQVRNDGTEWIRLDALRAHYPGSGETSLHMTDDALLGYDSSFYEFQPANPDKKRTAITSGGFGVTGAVMQQQLFDPGLPYGRALGVLAYKPPGASERYVVTGSYDYLIGDPPEDVTEDALVGSQAFLAIYDGFGSLSRQMPFPGYFASEMADLEDGRFLVVGKNLSPAGEEVLILHRIRLYDLDQDGSAINTGETHFDNSFGNEGSVWTAFYQNEIACEVLGTAGVTALSTNGGDTRYLAAASLRCDGANRAGLAMFEEDGSPTASFGDEGVLVLAGPGGVALRPVGVEHRKGFVLGWFDAWLAAGVGACGYGETGCEFGIARLDSQGLVNDFGWQTTTFPEAEAAVPHAMDVADDGKIWVGGTSRDEFTRYAAVARFSVDGSLDQSFGGGGLALTAIGGHASEIRSLDAADDLGAAAAVWVETAAGSSLGAIRFEENGNMVYGHETLGNDTLWKYSPIKENLGYGSYLEPDVEAFPTAVSLDGSDRALVVGGAYGSVDTPPWGGTDKVALVRYLPNGQPDSRRWLQPGGTLKIALPEDRTFHYPPPDVISIELDFLGGTLTDLQFDRPLTARWRHAVTSNPVWGSYHFPFGNGDLAFNEAATLSGHVLTHHHRHSENSRFAFDIGLGHWTGSHWTALVDGAGDASVNENFRVWNLPVRAMADGEIVACRRSTADNSPGSIDSTQANFVTIQHSFDAVDKRRREFMDYLHFKTDSIPEALCPNICPEDEPDCDPAVDGVDPDGRKLPEPIPVSRGDLIGRVGNSGISTAPHLHIQLRTGAGGASGDPFAGGIPILFSNVLLGDRFDNMGNEQYPPIWYEHPLKALPHGYLVVPGE